MRKEAVMVASALVAILALAGVVITPEQQEAIEAILVVVIPLALGLYARSQVASKDRVDKTLGKEAERIIFRK